MNSMAMRPFSRKRNLASTVTLQTNYTDAHRTYFRVMEENKFECFGDKAKVFENFFLFDFFEGVSVRYFDPPIRLDLTTWSKELLEKEISKKGFKDKL